MIPVCTESDLIRRALQMFAPCTRSFLAMKIKRNVLSVSFTAAIDELKVNGEIVETWSPSEGDILRLTEPLESPHAAPKPTDPSNPTTQQSECSTGQPRPVCGDGEFKPTFKDLRDMYRESIKDDENDKINQSIDLALEAGNAVSHLSEAYWQAVNELHVLRAKVARLQADSDAYHAIMKAFGDISHD